MPWSLSLSRSRFQRVQSSDTTPVDWSGISEWRFRLLRLYGGARVLSTTRSRRHKACGSCSTSCKRNSGVRGTSLTFVPRPPDTRLWPASQRMEPSPVQRSRFLTAEAVRNDIELGSEQTRNDSELGSEQERATPIPAPDRCHSERSGSCKRSAKSRNLLFLCVEDALCTALKSVSLWRMSLQEFTSLVYKLVMARRYYVYRFARKSRTLYVGLTVCASGTAKAGSSRLKPFGMTSS